MHYRNRIKLLILLIFTFHISSAQNYQPIMISGNHEGGVTVLTKDAEKKYLIAGDTKGYLYFHDLETGKLVKQIKAHGNEVKCLQFNSNGKLLISATYDGEIKIYDFNRNDIIQGIYSPDYSGIRFVLFSIADGFIYFNGNKKLYKTRSDLTQSVVEILNEKDTITDAVITSDRSSMIYSMGSSLKVLNTRTDLINQDFNTGPSKIQKIALVKDTLLATWSMDGSIYFWHYILGQINPAPLFFLKAGNPSEMSFSDDGKLMSSGNIGHWARIWKPMERIILQELFYHTNTVTSTCFGANNKMIYTGSLDGKIVLWKKDAPPPSDSLLQSINVPANLSSSKDTLKPPPKIQENIPTPTVVIAPKINDPEPTHPNNETGKPYTKDVLMTETNIPKIISGRKVNSNLKIDVDSSALTIFVYDNSTIDGDTMSLFFNGKWVLDHFGVTKKRQPVKLELVPNTNNYLVLFANNLGKSPPNSAAIEFFDGKNKRVFRLSSDLTKCSAINFFYLKK